MRGITWMKLKAGGMCSFSLVAHLANLLVKWDTGFELLSKALANVATSPSHGWLVPGRCQWPDEYQLWALWRSCQHLVGRLWNDCWTLLIVWGFFGWLLSRGILFHSKRLPFFDIHIYLEIQFLEKTLLKRPKIQCVWAP